MVSIMPISPRRSLALSCCLTLALAPLGAQGLQLDVVGGSLPGSLSLDTYPGLYPLEFTAIVPSFQTGPLPLALFDPVDPRSLDIGGDLLSAAWLGFSGLDGHLRIGPLAFAAVPGMQDVAIYFQAITIGGGSPFVDRISNTNQIRLANAGAFRDRLVSIMDDRAFATVLPRADRTWMVVGGGRGGLLSQTAHRTTSIYDPRTDSSQFGPQLTTPRSLHSASLLHDGRWLISGGVNQFNDPQALCEIYDPVADTFTAVAPMLSPRMGHTASVLADGRVFVTGGLQAMTVVPTALSAVRDATNTTEIYDPVADTWTWGPNLRTPRAAHAALTRPDGKVLLMGGISWDNVIIIGWLPAVRSTCDLYDPIANTIAAGPSMGTARSMVDPLDLGNGRWLLAGGISSLTLSNLGTPTASAEIYNANTNTWSGTSPMAVARGNHKAWALGNGQFLLAGGANGTILSPVPLGSTEVFSTTTNAFTAGPAMTTSRAGAAMFATPQGQIQLFGGASTNGSISNSTEWYYF